MDALVLMSPEAGVATVNRSSRYYKYYTTLLASRRSHSYTYSTQSAEQAQYAYACTAVQGLERLAILYVICIIWHIYCARLCVTFLCSVLEYYSNIDCTRAPCGCDAPVQSYMSRADPYF